MSSELKRIYFDTGSDPKIMEVEWPRWRKSKGPLYSRSYENCCGVAMIGNELCALSHFGNTRFQKPYTRERVVEYLDAMLACFNDGVPPWRHGQRCPADIQV